MLSASLEKITFEEYLSKAHVPTWVEKYRNALSTERQGEAWVRFEGVLRQLGLEEVVAPGCNRYMLGQLTYLQNKL